MPGFVKLAGAPVMATVDMIPEPKPNLCMPDIPEYIFLSTGETIPVSVLEFATSRSGGPGGQNVNKVETRVEVRLNIADSRWLSEESQARIREKLATRIDSRDTIRVTSSVARTQRANRIAAIEKLGRLLNAALLRERPRRATRPSAAANERRHNAKLIRSRTKTQRRWRPED